MSIGKQVKTLRLNRKATQEELANSLGVSGQAVSKWEKGLSLPSIALLPTLASYFGITVDELLMPLTAAEESEETSC